MRTSRVLGSLFILSFVWLLGAQPVAAATLKIEFTGLDLAYIGQSDGGRLCDAASCLGGGGNQAVADPLVSMKFLLDGNLLGELTTDIWADIDLEFHDPLEAGGGSAGSASGIIDLLTHNGTPGWGLGLNVWDGAIAWDGTSFAFTGSGSIWSVETQALPFGLTIGMPITFSFETLINGEPTTDTSGQYVTGFSASGSGDVTGQSVPEPGSVLLLGLGLVASRRAVRRRN